MENLTVHNQGLQSQLNALNSQLASLQQLVRSVQDYAPHQGQELARRQGREC